MSDASVENTTTSGTETTPPSLAKRLVNCRHFRWLPGLLIQTVGGPTDRIAGIDSTYIHAWAESQQTENPRGMWIRYRLDRMDKHGVPDLSDPATLGCLLALVREAWGCKIVTSEGNGWWMVETDHQCWDDDTTASFVEALVAALEAAPLDSKCWDENYTAQEEQQMRHAGWKP